MAKFKKIGDWEKVMAAISGVKDLMESEKEKTLDEFANESLNKLRFHIDNQDLPWRPLSERYLEQKSQEGSAQETYIRSKKFYDSLIATVDTEKGMAFAGIPSGEQTDEGESMEMIAAIHEFGALSVGIYERPLFRPTMEEMMQWIKEQNPAATVVDKLGKL